MNTVQLQKPKVLIAIDDMVSNKYNQTVTELFIRKRRLNISFCHHIIVFFSIKKC